MKTGTLLLAIVAAGATVSVNAQDLHEAYERANKAHAIAAELAARTLPHAHCNGVWNRAAQQAVAADRAVEAVLAGYSVGDFCTAYDAAEALRELSDDLEDSVEDLDPVRTAFGPGPGRDELRRIRSLAEKLEDVAGDVRRDARRLDRNQPIVRPGFGPPIYGVPRPGVVLPPNLVTPGSGIEPGYLGTPYGDPSEFRAGPGVPQTYPPAGRTQPGQPYGSDSLGPSVTTPPGQPSTMVPRRSTPAQPQPLEVRKLPPGQAKKGTIPPGQLKKIEPSQPGPLLAPQP